MSGNDDFTKERLYNKLDDLEDNVDQILIELNNGLKSEVHQNTDHINNLEKKVDKLYKIVDKAKGKNELKKKILKNISYIIGITGTLFGIAVKLGVI